MRLILLLVQFILIKIGQVPLLLIKVTVDRLQWTVKKLPRHRGRPRKTSLPKRTKIIIGISLSFIILYTYTSFIFTAAYQLPSPHKLVVSDKPLTTEFYDRGGKLLYRLYEGRNRTLTKLEDLPPYLIWATIALEDKNFYYHPGFDPLAIGRALYSRVAQGGEEGASTITQQLIKNSLLTPEKTYTRKLKEIILAFWAERIYSKNQILQMYFNEAPYGGPAWGIEAASQVYFGKSAKNLNLPESAFLAGLPASPTQFSPFGIQPELAKIRQKEVLVRMAKEGYISSAKADEAYLEPLNLKPPVNNIHAPHFVFYVKDYLSTKFGPRVVSQGGLKITTTLDLSLQEQVEKIISNQMDTLSLLNVKNGAAMVTDAKTGQILAMIGSRDYYYPGFGNFNVTLSLRQPGSSIKPITYATAFKVGYFPGNTILDSPVTFKDGLNYYSPVNYDGVFHGPISIRTALASSYNVPAVKMLASIGIPNMIQTAKDLGISTFDDTDRFGLSLTLGGGEITMIEMMGVYQVFSQMGILQKPTGILKVTDSEGNILEEYKDHPKQVLQPEVAYLITNILSDNKARTPAFGVNSLLNIADQVVAVKTGTSDNKRDNWTFGYTQNFVVGVWVGNNDNTPMNPQLTSGITGATPIWNKITKLLLEQHQVAEFPRPEGLVLTQIDGRTDLTISGIRPKSLVRMRKDGENTVFFDAFSSFATPSAQASTAGTTN